MDELTTLATSTRMVVVTVETTSGGHGSGSNTIEEVVVEMSLTVVNE
jgi:hypothetical protein